MKNVDSREILMLAYIHLQIYNKVDNQWLQNVLAPLFFSIGALWSFSSTLH